MNLGFDALGVDIRIDVDDDEIGGYVASLFRHLPPPAGRGPERWYRVRRSTGSRVAVHADGRPLSSAPGVGALHSFVRDVDKTVIARSPRLLLHAGGATVAGDGVALPARSGGGKSTLVAGLVRRGFGYLSDEFVSPDWESGMLRPYPRPVTLAAGSPAVEHGIALAPAESLAPLLEGRLQLDPESLRPGAVSGPCRLGWVIFPRLAPGERTELAPISRAQAVIDIVECTFHFHRHGGRALELLARVIAGCDSYRLTVGALDAACDAVCDAVGLAPRPVA